MKILSLLSQI